MRMRVLHRYLLGDYLLIFFITLLVFTFVMSLFPLLKAIDLLSKGVDARAILGIYFFNFPYQLTFAIPISTLTAALLLFGRLSMDGELNAMRASGLNIVQISTPILLATVVFTLVCLWVNNWASPRSHYLRNQTFARVQQVNPLDLIEEGKFNNQIPGLKIFIGRIEGENIYDVEIHELKDLFLTRVIRGREGTLTEDQNQKILYLKLNDVNIDQRERDDPTNETSIPAEHWEHPLDLKSIIKTKTKAKGRKDMTFRELFSAIRDVRGTYPYKPEDQLARQRLKLTIETNKRATLAVACLCFGLIGIPLGIKSKRKESSAGILISLVIVFVFYVFVLVAEALVDSPQILPHLIMWIPVFVSQGIGAWLLYRIR